MSADWYSISNVDVVASPALLVYPDRIAQNIRQMISIAGDAARLRPHIKTHKLPEVIRMQTGQGITKFKCATIAEAEMVAESEAADILLAYQLVGPNVRRFVNLIKAYPNAAFSTIADDAEVIHSLSDAFAKAGLNVPVWLDIDCGMHRSGITPGGKARELYRLINSSRGIEAGGLHVYDGHIHDKDPAARMETCNGGFALAEAFRDELLKEGLPVPRVVAGGTPTFPIHARRPNVECSPGTCLFWDFSYTTKLPDMNFLPAALVLTRIVSKPGEKRLCLDLGHKAVASENPHPRVHLLNLPDAKAVGHSEEHLVVESERADEFRVGDCLYGIPWHICPTVALHSRAIVVENHVAETHWKVVARERVLTV
jgi:D-threonine aldolase